MSEKRGDVSFGTGANSDPSGDFRALERRYRPMVYGTALRGVGCPETAGEVTQDVFLLLARKGGSVAPEHVGGWLHRATVLKSRERVRGERRYRRRLVEYARRRDSEVGTPVVDPRLDRLDAALDSLDDDDRRVIFLRYFEGMRAAEIAARLGISAEAAQKKCERARARLAERLAAGGLLTVAAARAQAAAFLEHAPRGVPPDHPASAAARCLAAVRRASPWGGIALVASLVGVLILRETVPRFDTLGQASTAHSPSPPIPRPEAGAPGEGAAADTTNSARSTAPPHRLEAVDLLQLAALLEQADEGDAAAGAEADAILDRTRLDALGEAASAVPALPTSPNQLRVLALGLVRHLTTRDPRRAVLAGEAFWRAQHGASAPVLAALVQEALWAWSRQDAAAARAWYDGIAAEGLFEDRGEEAPAVSAADHSKARALHAAAPSLEARVALARRLSQHPQPEDPAWLAMADVWAHTLDPSQARALAEALWQDPAVSRASAFTFRLALVSLPTSAPDESTLRWASTPHGAPSPDPVLASAVATAWRRRHPAGAVPEWMLPYLPPESPADPKTNR